MNRTKALSCLACLLLLALGSCNSSTPSMKVEKDTRMTPDKMVSIIKSMTQHVSAKGNVVEFKYSDVPMTLIYDVRADRMRIIMPITESDNISKEVLMQAMEANFHSAVDARYGVSNGFLWAAFIHPLSDLSEALLRSAIEQVAKAGKTFGTTFSSGDLIFSY